MNVFGAILRDSLHEARDRRALLVVGLMTLIAIAFCLGVSFRERSEEELVVESLGRLGRFERVMRRHSTSIQEVGLGLRLQSPRPARAAEGWSPELEGGVAIAFALPSAEQLDAAVRSWAQFYERTAESLPEPMRWVEQRLRTDGWDHAEARRTEGDPLSIEVAVRSVDKHRLRGAHVTTMLFGLIEFTDKARSREELVLMIQIGLAGGLLGFAGILVALLTCSGFVPSMLTKGTLDLSLARPVGRARLLLYKYLGGLWFIALTAVLIVGGTWAALALSTGVTEPRYLVMAPLSIAIFAILYTPVVLFAVLTRSANIAALGGIAIWWISAMIVSAEAATNGFEDVPSGVAAVLNALYVGLPKTSHIAELGQRYLVEARLGGGEAAERVLEGSSSIDWTFSLGTTIAFAAACLALACWRSRRTDY